jgi:WD40 repeat protein/energy-coupling factor transporter ATP-binding protein EcfA2
MLDLSGQTLKAYQIVEQLGAGGFGAVYRAIQPVIGREVAIKVILPEFANRPDFIRRFETEAQLVARLEHPHIVPLYDYWREPNSAYLVMRLLRSGSLRDRIEENGAMDVIAVVQLLNQIASALTFAHRNGVIHRDLKTDNILLDESGNYYLGDFGIAKDLGVDQNLTRDSILGTPAYLSPEQIRGEGVTARSDIYALGILVYEALTGSKPFFDLTPATILYRQLNDPLPNLQESRPDLPIELNLILQRATSKLEAMRYAEAIDFARDFQTAVRGAAGSITVAQGGTIDIKSITDIGDAIINATNPYKGLRAFQQADAGDFYGRDALRDRLLARLRENVPQSSFLAVVGPSGSGKSSVVKAALLTALQKGALDENAQWFTAEMVPGTHPFEELEAALLSISPKEMPDLLNQLREERGLVRAVKRILPDENAHLVLLIDQFEEVFTLIESEEERVRFLNAILTTVEDKRGRVTIIVTLRADFYDRPLLYGEFGELMRDRTELVLPLNNKELEAAILSPLSKIGMSAEPGLVNTIIKDVSQQPGALPLLQYALTELFERREGRLITLKAYQEIGGTAGALAKRAEELFSGFSKNEQEATRQLFLRLVTLGEGTEDTRRRVLQAELLSIGEHRKDMNEVIDLFGKYRLLTFDHDPNTRGSTVEVAHEALIRQWERLRGWLDENREGLRTQRRLISANDEWLSNNREASYLASGVRLEQFEEWAKSTDIALNEGEREYLRASIAAREAQRAAERERQAREERLEQQARTRLRALAIISTIAAVVGIALASLAITQRQAALDAQEEAIVSAQEALRARDETASLALASNARNALVSGNPRLALALAFEAEKAYSPAPAEVLRVLGDTAYAEGLRYVYGAQSGSILSGSIAPDGKTSLTASLDGTIVAWDNATGTARFTLTLEGTHPTDVRYSPDGARFAVASADGSVTLYDADGTNATLLGKHAEPAMSVAFSQDGAQLVSGGQDRALILWDTATASEVRRFEGSVGAILSVAFSPDGALVAASTSDETVKDDPNDTVDRKVRLWNVESGELVLTIEPRSGFLRTIAFSPNGQRLAVGMWDSANSGTVRLYDTATGEETRRFFAHSDSVTDIAFSSDGTRLATVSWDKTARVWDVVRGVEVQTFTAFEEQLLSVDYSKDGDYLLLGLGNIGGNYGYDRDRATYKGAFWWDLRKRDVAFVYREHTDWAWTTDVSPDGVLVASGAGPLRLPQDLAQTDVSVRVWNAQTGATVAVLNGHKNTVDSVRFLPDGKRLLSGSWDGTIILWDIASASPIRTYELPRVNDAPNVVYKLALHPNGTRFVSGSQDGTARLWSIETGEELATFAAHERAINGVAFSPDGTRLATGSSDRTIKLWNVATGELLRTLEGHTDTVNEVIFAPDGRTLFSSSWDDTVRRWNAETGEQIAQFVGHTSNTFGLAVTKDGALLLSTSTDRTIRLWDTASGAELYRYSGHTDWIQEVALLPDERGFVSSGQDRTVRLWRLARTPQELIAFAEANRALRTLTCAERVSYRLSACEAQ